MSKDIATANSIAAHRLMTQWVVENANELASDMADLVAFICEECGFSDLQGALNTVNITFATVALEVVKQRNENEDEARERMPLCLPADAIEMQNSLYDLSRFLAKFSRLASLLERNEKMPAFRMTVESFYKADSL